MIVFMTGCETRAHFSEGWTDLVDRGGLIHISDSIFLFFVAMEVVVKPHFSTNNPSLLQKGLKERVIDDVVQESDVLFHWSMIASNWVEEDADELLKTIVNHWVTLRGFSFVSGFNEQYKKEHTKTLEKSKGTRKYLIGESKSFDPLA